MRSASLVKTGAAVVVCLMVSLAGVVGSVAAASPPEGSSIAAVFPPWWSQTQTLNAAASAGPVLAAGASGAVWVVASDKPGLATRLRAAGALVLLDPASWQGCLAAPKPAPSEISNAH